MPGHVTSPLRSLHEARELAGHPLRSLRGARALAGKPLRKLRDARALAAGGGSPAALVNKLYRDLYRADPTSDPLHMYAMGYWTENLAPTYGGPDAIAVPTVFFVEAVGFSIILIPDAMLDGLSGWQNLWVAPNGGLGMGGFDALNACYVSSSGWDCVATVDKFFELHPDHVPVAPNDKYSLSWQTVASAEQNPPQPFEDVVGPELENITFAGSRLNA